MEKIIKKIVSLVGGLALVIGVSSSSIASQGKSIQNQGISHITESSPLYLEHSINFSSQANDLAWHTSHVSHSSHSSHVSHHSHYSG